MEKEITVIVGSNPVNPTMKDMGQVMTFLFSQMEKLDKGEIDCNQLDSQEKAASQIAALYHGTLRERDQIIKLYDMGLAINQQNKSLIKLENK